MQPSKNIKSKRIIFAATGVLVTLIVVFVIFREPSYQGRSLSGWLTALDPLSPGHIPEEKPRAEEAIRQIGPKAVPHLRAMLRAKESWWQTLLRDHHAKVAWLGIDKPPKTERLHWRAAFGARLLGPAALETAEDLKALFGDPSSKVRQRALHALNDLGLGDAELLLLFRNALKDQDHNLADMACVLLGEKLPLASQLAPELTGLLQHQDKYTRQNALSVLARVRPEDRQLLEPTLQQLANRDSAIRSSATIVLFRLKLDPAERQSLLKPLLNDPDVTIRNQVTNLLGLSPVSPVSTGRLTVTLPDALKYYEELRGKKLIVVADIRTVRHATVSILTDCPKEVAAKFIEIALKESLGLVIDHLPNGDIQLLNASLPAPSAIPAQNNTPPAK